MWEEKEFISPQQLLEESVQLAYQIFESGFRPDFMMAFWRGGTPIAITVHDFFRYHGIDIDHIAIRTDGRDSEKKIRKEIRVFGLEYFMKLARYDMKLLIVDDIFDTGSTFLAVDDVLRERLKRNMPEIVKRAALYYKPKKNLTQLVPDFYIHKTDKWVVFPHEFEGLSLEEIREGKGEKVVKYFDK